MCGEVAQGDDDGAPSLLNGGLISQGLLVLVCSVRTGVKSERRLLN